MRWGLTIPGIDDRLLSTMKNKSFKPEVLVDGQWSTNGLRFATAEENHFPSSCYINKDNALHIQDKMKNDFDTDLMLIMGWITLAMAIAGTLVIVVGKLIFGA